MIFVDDSGERNATRNARGVFAAIIFFALTYAVAFNFILLPARETGLVTVKETRSLSLPHDFAADTTVWNVVLVSTSCISYVHEALREIITMQYRHEMHRTTTHQPIGIASSTAQFRSYLCGITPVRLLLLSKTSAVF